MARETKRLSAKSVAALSDPGRHADGEGLYLNVLPSGSKSWLFMFRWDAKGKNKRVEMGLGRYPDIGLADARQKAADARRLIEDGVNPLEARKETEAKALAEKEAAPPPTFGQFADELVKSVTVSFRNAKHRQQWSNTLRDYAKPLKDKLLDEITTSDVLTCLTQKVTLERNGKKVTGSFWDLKTETASRVRGRIERVFDAAIAKGLRKEGNPALWKPNLKPLLSARQKLARGHHKAMPYTDVPAFLAQLREIGSVSALALEWTILSAARTGETIGARLEEIDRDAKVWTVPATRMKAGREHRVPLTDRMLEILDVVDKVRDESPFVFPGSSRRRPLSNMAMSMILRRMSVDATPHGFRSSFRDWAGNETAFPSDLAEAALAHTLRNAVEAAYRRDTALEKRRRLMAAWANYCGKLPADNVRPFRGKAAS